MSAVTAAEQQGFKADVGDGDGEVGDGDLAVASWLDSIQVAKPCKASWADMTGDARQRMCADCGQHVYDLTAMKKDEAETFVRTREGRTCVRFFRRADGRVLTVDCGEVLGALKRRPLRALKRRAVMAVVALAAGAGVAGAAAAFSGDGDGDGDSDRWGTASAPYLGGGLTMGEMEMHAPPPSQVVAAVPAALPVPAAVPATR